MKQSFTKNCLELKSNIPQFFLNSSSDQQQNGVRNCNNCFYYSRVHSVYLLCGWERDRDLRDDSREEVGTKVKYLRSVRCLRRFACCACGDSFNGLQRKNWES